MMKNESEKMKPLSDKPIDETHVYKRTNLSNIFTGIIVFITVGYLLFSLFRSMNVIDLSGIEIFNTIFISILMQAFPFMLIGVLVSSAMHVFISDEWIVKAFSKICSLFLNFF